MLLPIPATAALILNAAGTSLGLRVTTIVSGFSFDQTCQCGPTGSTSNSDGDLLVADHSGNIFRFKNLDGQTVADALNVVSGGTGGGALALAGGKVYLAQQGKLYALQNNGSVDSLKLGGATVTSLGLTANPVSGHLYSNSNSTPATNLVDIDPVANTYALHAAGGGETVAVSLDGTTVYNSQYPVLAAFDTTSFAVRWTSDAFGGATGTIQIGALADDLISFDETNGMLWHIDKDDGRSTLIGNGSPRGFGHVMGVNNDGSLMFSIGSDLFRITAAVAEPASWWLCLLGLFLAVTAGRRQRATPARWLKARASFASDAPQIRSVFGLARAGIPLARVCPVVNLLQPDAAALIRRERGALLSAGYVVSYAVALAGKR